MTLEKTTSWYVYIILCADKTLYTGITTSLEKRITTHNLGKGAKYTKPRLPVSLVYSEKHANKSSASKREAQIKSLSRQEKLEIIN